jgi:hypothetical protein
MYLLPSTLYVKKRYFSIFPINLIGNSFEFYFAVATTTHYIQLPDHFSFMSGSASSQATVIFIPLFDSTFLKRLNDAGFPAVL